VLSVLFLVRDTAISGETKLQLAMADALSARGHAVSVASTAEPPSWRATSAEWIELDDWHNVASARCDVALAASLPLLGHFRDAPVTTVHLLLRAGDPPPLSLRRAPHARIAVGAAASAPSADGVPAWHVPPIVDEEFYSARGGESSPLRVLLTGAAQSDPDAIADGYGAVNHARYWSAACELVRLSPWAPPRDEPVEESGAEFHAAVDARAAAALFASCDVFLSPQRRTAGPGLATYEALAARLPSVLSSTPAHLAIAGEGAAVVASEGDAEALGERLLEILTDGERRSDLRNRAGALARRFSPAEAGALFAETVERIAQKK
jgi:hypothetical protein